MIWSDSDNGGQWNLNLVTVKNGRHKERLMFNGRLFRAGNDDQKILDNIEELR